MRLNPATYKNRRPAKRFVCLSLLVALILQAAPVLIAESTTTRTAGGLDFTAKGGKRQGREVPQSLRVEPGANHPVWKTQSSAEPSIRHQTGLLYKAALPKTDPDEPGTREQLAKGTFLVASRRLQDPNFKETVVLLVDYGLDGAMGLVINRPSAVRLATVFPDIKELKERKDTVYVGGPVSVNQMLMLIRSANVPEASQEITQDVYISSSWKVLERLIKRTAKDETFRLFAGYAGWAPNQLDLERSRGDWYVLKADAAAVFTQNPAELWPELIRRVTAKWVRNENLLKNLN